jgi:hypothetical protein
MRLVDSWPLHLLGCQLLEVARVEVGGVVDQYVDAAEAVDGRFDRRLGVRGAGDIELDGKQLGGGAECFADRVGVAAGGDHVVARGERGLRELHAHAASGAGDEPCLLASHLCSLSCLWRPLASSKKARDRGT